SEDFRVVQLTPPGSPCSIIFGKGVTAASPGSVQDLMLVVDDVEAARSDLIDHGVEVSGVFHDEGGVFHHAGTKGRVPGSDPQGRSYCTWASFNDPDGNGWMLQEIKERLPGRVTLEPLNGKATDVILEALKSASVAHGEHEKEIGRPDPDWPQWYAAHMSRTLSAYLYDGPRP